MAVVINDINSIEEFAARQVDVSVAYVLFWLAANSDKLNALNNNIELKKYLSTLSLQKQTLIELLNLAKQQNDQDLLQVCEILRVQLNNEEKLFFLKMAVIVATVTAKLTTNVNHILRFLADLLNLGQECLANVYFEHTKQSLTEPEDLSSPSWWTEFEENNAKPTVSDRTLSRKAALKVLGLNPTASASEIKQAYRRLVHVYHPDRQTLANEPSAQVAESKFLQIQNAYEVLKQ